MSIPPEGEGHADEEAFVIARFLDSWLADRERGVEPDLAAYQARWPQHASLLAREGARLHAVSASADQDTPPLPAPVNDVPGSRLGPYEFERELGRGGFGVVWLAADTRLGRRVALKLLSAPVAGAMRTLERFQREAELAARLGGRGICTVYESGVLEGRPFIAMEYVAGETLAERLARARTEASDPATTAELVHLVERVAHTLQQTHEAGVIHRDLKASNVIIDEDGQPVVLDFGLARELSGEGHTLTLEGQVFGTPLTMSPEQVRGETPDPRCDIWALGVLLHEVLTGRPPFLAPTQEALFHRILNETLPDRGRTWAGVPRDLVTIVTTALHKEPAARYATAGDLAEDLRRQREHEPIRARRLGPLGRTVRWCRRRPALAGLLATIVLAIATTIVLLTRQVDLLQRERVATSSWTVRGLLASEEELWPARPRIVARMDAWLSSAASVFALEAEIRAAPPASPSPEDQARHDRLAKDLATLALRHKDVLARRTRASTLAPRTLHDAQAAWTRAAELFAKGARSEGLTLQPQLGLVPLGRDSVSGWLLFWHVESGARPEWTGTFEAGRPTFAADTGIVLALLPPDRFLMGAQSDDPSAESHDPMARPDEAPVHEVALDAHFIALTELTQNQWMRVMRTNPSGFIMGDNRGRRLATGRDPVHNITWTEADQAARRLDLRLVTEAEWEHACRAGTRTPWCGVRDPAKLSLHANLKDEGARTRDPDLWPPHIPMEQGMDDGHVLLAPAAALAPNPWGLHDLHGNLAEWCADARSLYSQPARSGDGLRSTPSNPRIVRGGSWYQLARDARSARRLAEPETQRRLFIGVRLARDLDQNPARR